MNGSTTVLSFQVVRKVVRSLYNSGLYIDIVEIKYVPDDETLDKKKRYRISFSLQENGDSILSEESFSSDYEAIMYSFSDEFIEKAKQELTAKKEQLNTEDLKRRKRSREINMTIAEKVFMGIQTGQYPPYLYRYRPNNEFTKKMITDNELWFSSPTEFNDPYDCNIPLNNKSSKTEIREYLAGLNICKSEIEQYISSLEKDPDFVKKYIKKVLEEMGVCCFSSYYDTILQWAHYADSHKGVCFTFDTLELIKTLGDNFFPLPVCYQKELPTYNHFTQKGDIAKFIVKPKWMGWTYEAEIRLVKNKLLTNPDEKGCSVKFGNNALKEIIFGSGMDSDTINDYRKLCEDNGKSNLLFSKMILGEGKYYKLNKIQL